MDASARTSQFLTRKIDVMSVYLSNEWPQIEKRANVKFNILRVSCNSAFAQMGVEPWEMKAEELTPYVRAEHKRWGEVIRAAGIKAE